MIRKETEYVQACETIRHYSERANAVRQLLITQSFAWLTALAYLVLRDEPPQPLVILVLIALASAFTMMLHVIHKHFFDFLFALTRRVAMTQEGRQGIWTTVDEQMWKKQGPVHRKILQHAAVVPMAAYMVAGAVALTASANAEVKSAPEPCRCSHASDFGKSLRSATEEPGSSLEEESAAR